MKALRLKGPINLARGEALCWSCGHMTPVFALEAADLKDLGHGSEPMPLGHSTFVHGIEGNLPSSLRDGLLQRAPSFRPTFSRRTGTSYWANNCVHCGKLQGDFFLHQEPDGPFFGGPESFTGERILLTAKNIELSSGSYEL